MKILRTPEEMLRFAARSSRRRGATGFVPTMGALHEGHLSLIRTSRGACATTVVSLYVNPLQFGPGEDFDTYPRDLEGDLALLKKERVSVVFLPDDAAMYPPGFSTRVVVGGSLTAGLCAPHRPGHFEGVATVVARLLGLVRPDRLYLGLKDYQQFRVLQRMVEDLALPVEVVGCPVVREPDGLAFSSRNRRLSQKGREAAPVLYRALKVGKALADLGETDPARVLAEVRRVVTEEKAVRLQYLEAVDGETLAPVEKVGKGTVLALAAYLENVRLIDNIMV